MKKHFLMGAMVVFLMAGFMAGCITLKTAAEPICSQVPEGEYSVICDVAELLGASPEAAASLLKVGNLGALIADAYVPQEAMAVLDEADAFLRVAQQEGLTYAAATKAAKKQYTGLSPKMQAVFIVLEDFMEVPQVQADRLLSDFDFGLLYATLDDQRRLIRPFLIE